MVFVGIYNMYYKSHAHREAVGLDFCKSVEDMNILVTCHCTQYSYKGNLSMLSIVYVNPVFVHPRQTINVLRELSSRCDEHVECREKARDRRA